MKVFLVPNYYKQEAVESGLMLELWLTRQGYEVAWAADQRSKIQSTPDIDGSDLVITLGAHQRRRSLKLRLYKRAECTRRRQARQHRIDNVRDAGKRDITHSQVDGAGIAKLRQLRHVCALMQRHAIVLT